jgi:hypothetical protein
LTNASIAGKTTLMAEVWLRSNRRAILWAMSLPAVLILAGALFLYRYGASAEGLWLGIAPLVLGCLGLAVLTWQLGQPRLSYEDGQLSVYLRRGAPLRVPVSVIECFLLGQAGSRLPTAGGHTKTATVLIRLCPSADEWVRGDVDPRLGEWRDSHFVIRGTWCEPLSVDVVQRLNAKLGAAQRDRRRGVTE